MINFFIVFILTFLVSSLFTPIIRRTACRLNLLDKGSNRTVHKVPVPRIGGIAIYLSFLAGLVFIAVAEYVYFFKYFRQFSAIFAGGTLIFIIGLYDDVHGLDAKKKFILQILVSSLLILLDFKIQSISNPFGPPVNLGFFAIPVTLIWIVGITNALNLIDGLDGLASGITAISSLILFVVASWDNKFFVAVIMIILAGSSIGFLWHNFNPASIFMGDCGSMLLGFILASVCIMDAYKGALAISLFIPFIALGLPIFDTVSSFIRRIYHGKPPFQADKNHIHHKLLRLGLNQQEAVGVLYLISLILGGVALFLAAKKGSNLIIYLCGIALLVIFFILRGEKKFLYIIKEKFKNRHIIEDNHGDKK